MKGIRFLTFGIREAFAARLLQKCTVLHERREWLYQEFEQGVDEFIVRTMHRVRNTDVPEQYIHCTSGAASLTRGKKRSVLFFAIVAVFFKKRMIGLSFEPQMDIPPEFDEWVEEKDMYVRAFDPRRHRSQALDQPKRVPEDYHHAAMLTDVAMHGFDIGMEMYRWSRHGFSKDDLVVRH